MTDKPISPLRQRMIEDMTARHFAEKAPEDYIRHVKSFAAFLGRSPDAATAEDLLLFLLHMAKTHVSPWTINATIVALQFFFKVTLEGDDLVRRLTLVREPRRAPTVLSPEEVARLLEAASDAKYKASLGVAYGAGLRVPEVVALKLSDIDNKRRLAVVGRSADKNQAAVAKITEAVCEAMAIEADVVKEDDCRRLIREGGARSSASDFVTGVAIPVDGGYSLEV